MAETERERGITWFVGDIHGMYDQLKRLITELRLREKVYDIKVRKIIFLGDYIDYGPSSKEVLDLLMSLPYETIFMAGNHEDMLLHYIKKSYFYEEYGNMWFNGNGGQDTVLSFDPEPGIYKKVNSYESALYYGNKDEMFEPGDFTFTKKYMDFFNNLVYTHVETIEQYQLTIKLAVSHASLLAHANFPLEEQLQLRTYDDFHHYIQEKKIFQKDFNLWSRKEPTEKYGDYILIHGHTPVEILAEYYQNLGNYNPASGLPYFRFKNPEIIVRHEESSPYYHLDAKLEDLISINIDTGAAFGKYLTAIGIADDFDWQKEFHILQAAGSGHHRGRKTAVRKFTFKVDPSA